MAGGFRSFKSEKQRKMVMAILAQRRGGGMELNQEITNREQLHSDQQTMMIVVTKKRRIAVIEKLRKQDVVMSDDEIQHVTNSLNRMEFRGGGGENSEFAMEVKELVGEHPVGVMLDEDLTKKGLEYLTRTVISKQLGEREKNIVDDFREFHLIDWHDDFNGFRHFFQPQWQVVSNSGETFEYVFAGSRNINIVG